MTCFDTPDWQTWRPRCDCASPVQLVQFEIAGGAHRWGLQCQGCKIIGNAVAQRHLSQEDRERAAHRFVTAEQRREQRRLADVQWLQRHREENAQKHFSENEEWWSRYNAYLLSPEWKARRFAVLERDGYVCQACRRRRAVQVHHLTYRHVFHEPMFDLVSVCVTCHDEITAMERGTVPLDPPRDRLSGDEWNERVEFLKDQAEQLYADDVDRYAERVSMQDAPPGGKR